LWKKESKRGEQKAYLALQGNPYDQKSVARNCWDFWAMVDEAIPVRIVRRPPGADPIALRNMLQSLSPPPSRYVDPLEAHL